MNYYTLKKHGIGINNVDITEILCELCTKHTIKY